MIQTWIAGRTEQRIALVISLLCATVVVVAVIRFFFLPTPPTQIITQEIQPKPITDAKKPHKEMIPQAYTPPVQKVVIPTPITAPAIEKINPEPVKTIHKSKPVVKKTTTSILPHGFYVQLGAFKASNRAKAMLKRLKRWKPQITPRNKFLHAVWVGPFASRNLAEKAKKKIFAENKLQGFIIKH